LEQRLVLSGSVGIWVETIQSTGEHPGSPAGKFRFHTFACLGSNPPASVTVGFQLSGKATQGSGCGGDGDYTGDITSGTVTIPVAENQDKYVDLGFDAIDDQEVEDTETVIVTLDEGGDFAIAEIVDDDVNVWVEATDDQASEDGRDPATFTIHRVGPLGGELTVYYSLGGAATPGPGSPEQFDPSGGADYLDPATPPGGSRSVVFQPGQETATVTITPFNDMLDEEQEAVTLDLMGGPDYTLSASLPTNAQAMLASLRLKKVQFVDDAPTGTVDINALVTQLGDSDSAKRDDAARKLRGLLDQRPELENDLQTRANNEDDPEIKVRLQNILAGFNGAVVRLVSRGDFTIKLKLAKPVAAGSTAKVSYSKAEGPGDFVTAGKGELVGGEVDLPDLKILPLKSGKAKIRVTVEVTDAAGNKTTTTQDIEIEIDTRQAA
jgi:hypothetical protein